MKHFLKNHSFINGAANIEQNAQSSATLDSTAFDNGSSYCKKLDRRSFLKKSVAATIGATLMPLPMKAFAREPELKIGYIPITDATPLLIAHSLGFFRDEGLKVQRPVMIRSWTVLTESFIGGKFNLTHMLFPIPVWMRFSRNIPVKVLAWDHTNGSAVTVHGESGIRGFGDLGGKQIAVPSWYSMHNFILQMGIMAKGLTPVIRPQDAELKSDEVNLFVLPPSEMPPALLGRKMDGFIVAEPFNALAEMKLNARIMRFTGDIWKNHPCCVLVSHEQLLKEQPVFIQKAVNAVVRAQLWCTKNPERAAHILSREGDGYLPVHEEVLLRVFTGYDDKKYLEGPKPRPIMHPEWQTGRIGFQPYPYPSATRFIIEQMARTKVEGDTDFIRAIDPVRGAGLLVDDTFVKKAMQEMRVHGTFGSEEDFTSFAREEVIEIG
ncbi:NtrA [Desulfamplus magnetovallimortis]|uniref:NtrA n=1 Tax=Desulfamplus magnetovallimortis TaxID=1246637 RepID=A0A1W1H5E3_9BACT|nr:ABC transporter substrate-binding protein [Desulfamplus magnetovallimortis]SLM27664.1 NtrA [Desulfamplus magnetovallimortis]